MMILGASKSRRRDSNTSRDLSLDSFNLGNVHFVVQNRPKTWPMNQTVPIHVPSKRGGCGSIWGRNRGGGGGVLVAEGGGGIWGKWGPALVRFQGGQEVAGGGFAVQVWFQFQLHISVAPVFAVRACKCVRVCVRVRTCVCACVCLCVRVFCQIECEKEESKIERKRERMCVCVCQRA